MAHSLLIAPIATRKRNSGTGPTESSTFENFLNFGSLRIGGQRIVLEFYPMTLAVFLKYLNPEPLAMAS